MKLTKNYALENYATVASVIEDKTLTQKDRSFVFTCLIEKYFYAKKAEQRKFFKELLGYTIALSPNDIAYLKRANIIKTHYSEDGTQINYNRNPTDWSVEKNVAGFLVSLYKTANMPKSLKTSPAQFGYLNNMIIRIFWKGNDLHLSIADGGHRSEIIAAIRCNHVYPRVKCDEWVSDPSISEYNRLFADKSIFCKDEGKHLVKMMEDAILPVVFSDDPYVASYRNRTKSYDSDNHIALEYRENPLWLRMKRAVCGENQYGEMMSFYKGIDANTIGALFIAGKLLGLHKNSKYNIVRYMLNTMVSHERIEKIVALVADYYHRLYSRNDIHFLKKNGKAYHTSRTQAIIHSIQCVITTHPARTEISRRYRKEYNNLLNRGDFSVVDGTKVKPFGEYFESTYLGYRQASTIDARFLLATDTINYIEKNIDNIVEHSDDIMYILLEYGTCEGSGNSGCDRKIVPPMVDCLLNGKWTKYNTCPAKYESHAVISGKKSRKRGVANA